jgi:pyruvate,orthophosphate dikinase
METQFYAILPGTALPEGGAEEVGNKGWNLARMAAAGLPVPPAFVLPTSWCRHRRGGVVDDAALQASLREGIGRLESATTLTFGSSRRPLLVSVRSGAAVSMPGMMETVLDVGLNAATVEGMIRLTGNPRLAWDSYRRLVQGYGEVVLGLPAAPFETLTRSALAEAEVDNERELDHRGLRALTQAMLERFRALAGTPFPQDPFEQLRTATAAVFRSWDAAKAVTYRRLNAIANDLGTAVVVQTMVYGNAGGASGAGVGFTRNPATGEHELYFDFVFNGQGEDVVAGRQELPEADKLRQRLPLVFAELERVARALEQIYADAQDFEFTLQSGRLYLLQTRRAKRTPWAALRIAVDLVDEGLITPRKALGRLAGVDIDAVGRTRFATAGTPVGHARVAGMGVASGAIALDGAAAEQMAEAGTPVILVRRETSTSDVAAMARADGILTASGGRTSHAAVVARQLGKVCLVACADLRIDLDRRVCTLGGQEFAEGDFLSLDGNEGSIYAGRLEAVTDRPERALRAIAAWREAVG